MQLEARAAHCFSSTFVLKLDGHATGKFEGRWFSETLDVALTERRRLQFHKTGWLGSGFILQDPERETTLGRAERGGFFTSRWDLVVSTGAGTLERAGWFDSAFVFRQNQEILARVNRLGVCERGWLVEGVGGLTDEDLLLIGLVYHTLREREARRSHSGGPMAGS